MHVLFSLNYCYFSLFELATHAIQMKLFRNGICSLWSSNWLQYLMVSLCCFWIGAAELNANNYKYWSNGVGMKWRFDKIELEWHQRSWSVGIVFDLFVLRHKWSGHSKSLDSMECCNVSNTGSKYRQISWCDNNNDGIRINAIVDCRLSHQCFVVIVSLPFVCFPVDNRVGTTFIDIVHSLQLLETWTGRTE